MLKPLKFNRPGCEKAYLIYFTSRSLQLLAKSLYMSDKTRFGSFLKSITLTLTFLPGAFAAIIARRAANGFSLTGAFRA